MSQVTVTPELATRWAQWLAQIIAFNKGSHLADERRALLERINNIRDTGGTLELTDREVARTRNYTPIYKLIEQ